MKTYGLARVFELKYGLKPLTASKDDAFNQVKKDLINAYTLYVDSEKAKEPVLQIVANMGEPFSKRLIHSMEELIANIDKLSVQAVFRRVNGILGSIRAVKNDPEKQVRNFIHDSVRVNKESEKNYREHVKSKFEVAIARISSILEKQARVLQSLIRLENPEDEAPGLEGGAVEPQRKELSKDKLLTFMRSPAAQNYGLDSLDTLTRILTYPDLKEKITTIINAVDRGHSPIDGPDVRMAVAEIMKIFNDRQQTNLTALEEKPEKPAPSVSILGEEEQEATL
jgi:hypothetical protein